MHVRTKSLQCCHVNGNIWGNPPYHGARATCGLLDQGAIPAPLAVREADLVERVWPPAHLSRLVDAPAKPDLALQVAMAPCGAFANFRLAPGGASTWVHVITGRKVSQYTAPASPCAAAVGAC